MTIPSANIYDQQHSHHRLFPMISRVRDLLWRVPDMTIESPEKRIEDSDAVVSEVEDRITGSQTLAAVPLPEFSLSQVSDHCSPDDCWIVIFDKVYDVTEFLTIHPGGEYILLESAGRDATIPFRGSRHGKDSYQLLTKYLIGILPENERMYVGHVIKS